MFRVFKEVSTLPASPAANAIYLIRVGAGFTIHVTNDAGQVFNLNLPQAVTFTTDDAAQAYSVANPTVTVFSTQAT